MLKGLQPTFNIDGQKTTGILLSKENFIKKFFELRTLMLSDDSKYWVLYEEIYPETPMYQEYFLCIPSSEICFICYDNEWDLLDDDEEDEEDEECITLSLEYIEALKEANRFMDNFYRYLMYNKHRNKDDFDLWLTFMKSIYKNREDDEIISDNKVCVLTWLKENWGAYTECILEGTYTYMNVSKIVLKSWEEFCR